jgi:hypothetical protein
VCWCVYRAVSSCVLVQGLKAGSLFLFVVALFGVLLLVFATGSLLFFAVYLASCEGIGF